MTNFSASPNNQNSMMQRVVWPLILTVVIVVVWSRITGHTSLAAWSVPIGYGEDSYLYLANAKAYMDGDISLFVQKWVTHLNAPFTANWNDWPITEDVIPALMGWLGRLFGLFPAANLMVLLCHVFAGLSFWLVGRELNCRHEYIFLGAVAYSLAHFLFVREFVGHIVLSMYWHLPWLALVSWWVVDSKSLVLVGRRGAFAIGASTIAGALNPYYAWMYIQFLGFAILKHYLRRDLKAALTPVLLAGITITVFIVFNLDTFLYAYSAGKNTGAVERSLASLEVYGLKFPELFLPGSHRWSVLADFAQRNYFSTTLIKGEMGSPYLGFAGIVGLVWLLVDGLFKLLKSGGHRICVAWWQVLWVSLYSLIGGINLLLGSVGLLLFRGTNRYSIVILTLALMFLIQALSKNFPGRIGRTIALLLVPVVLWDQLPSRVTAEAVAATARIIESDRDFATSIEKQSPKDSMVFQLPFMPFPERPPIVKMADYEHFRPYLHTATLRYSYGTNKGRGDESWQKVVADLSPQEIVEQLEKYGFNTLIINKKGYADRGEQLIENIVKSGRGMIADSPDMIALALRPDSNPMVPLNVQLLKGWSFPEDGHRWAEKSNAEIVIRNQSMSARKATLGFGLRGLQPQTIDLLVAGNRKERFTISRVDEPVQVQLVLEIPPGQTSLELVSDVIPALPGTNDLRNLAFDMVNFKLNYD